MNNAIIEEGSKLLDVGTFAEFEEFAKRHISTEPRRTLLRTVQDFVRSENRAKAIAHWRDFAKTYDEAPKNTASESARMILRAGGVSRLTQAEMRRAEIAFGSLMAASYVKAGDPAVLDREAELNFAIAVAIAKKFDAVAQDLNVKLP